MPGLLGYCETKAEEDWHLEQERQLYEAARDAEEWDQLRKRITELEAGLRLIAEAAELAFHDPKSSCRSDVKAIAVQARKLIN